MILSEEDRVRLVRTSLEDGKALYALGQYRVAAYNFDFAVELDSSLLDKPVFEDNNLTLRELLIEIKERSIQGEQLVGKLEWQSLC